jgi:Cytochrome C oxidase, cbb3-type, subunit III
VLSRWFYCKVMTKNLRCLPLIMLALSVTWQVRSALAQESGSIWKGVYTQEQAERAKVRFTSVCRRCHNDDLGGSDRGPSLRGERFMANWETQGLNLLFAKIRNTMPPDAPTSLPDDEYLDLVTLILQANSFPAGAESLSAAKLEDILIMKRPGDGPVDVPNFRMVQVVGCLAKTAGDTWMLTSSSGPVLTNDQPPKADVLKSADAQPLGTGTVRLMSANPFNPDAHHGHKMYAKGLIYHAPDRDRINLISLEMLSQRCGS